MSPRDALTLIRPKIALLVLVTTWVGAIAAGVGSGWLVVHACVGTLLVTAAASALNQLLEIDTDALMDRTRDRPLPAGRTTPGAVLAFSLALAVAGEVELWLGANLVAAALGLATLLLYVLVYTPLKRRTTFNTVVGAIAGAAPPVIGWAAARGSVDRGALSLFAIVFLWQFPHFLAIAWLHRDDYAKAGLRMLPSVELGRGLTRRAVPHYAIALVPASVVPTLSGVTGPTYFVGALALSVAFLGFALGFSLWESRAGARRLLLASIAYLPILFCLMVLDRASA